MAVCLDLNQASRCTAAEALAMIENADEARIVETKCHANVMDMLTVQKLGDAVAVIEAKKSHPSDPEDKGVECMVAHYICIDMQQPWTKPRLKLLSNSKNLSVFRDGIGVIVRMLTQAFTRRNLQWFETTSMALQCYFTCVFTASHWRDLEFVQLNSEVLVSLVCKAVTQHGLLEGRLYNEGGVDGVVLQLEMGFLRILRGRIVPRSEALDGQPFWGTEALKAGREAGLDLEQTIQALMIVAASDTETMGGPMARHAIRRAMQSMKPSKAEGQIKAAEPTS